MIKNIIIKFFAFFYSKRRSKTIFYHDLHSDYKYTEMSTHINLFKIHIQLIKDLNYQIVDKITNKYGQIQICFDDGFKGIYDNIDVINKLDIYLKLFIITSYIGKSDYLNHSQIVKLNSNKNINLQSHTHSHHRLNSLSENDVKDELIKSKNILEDILNKKIDSICFPEGRFSNKVIKLCKEIGYKKIYSSLPGFNHANSNFIYRSFVQDANDSKFRSILKGGDNILFYWYNLKHNKNEN